MEAVLDPRTQLLIAVGAVVAAKCQQCFAKLHATAGQLGVSERGVRAAVAVATTVAAKSREFMAAFIEETTGGAVPAAAPDSGCGCAS